MTNRLYYDNAYLTDFDAKVLEIRGQDVRLDQSAFYPTSGGQPYDTGTLGGYRVLDVFVDDALEVWHRTDGEFHPGELVHGRIDWPRRFDHMQQHAGEHMLANACYRLHGGHTIGLHLGHDFSTIDVELPDGTTRLPQTDLDALEDDVNQRIQRDVPIRCWFPTEEELRSLPLRKPPTVQEHVRVVQIGTEEYVACGGTHPSSAGQIGLIKILDGRPSKGKLRLSFVCGMRAFQDYRRCYALSGMAAERLSTGRENLPGAVERLQAHLRETEHSLWVLRREMLLGKVSDWLTAATPLPDGTRLVRQRVEADAALLRELAAALTKQPRVIVLLCAPAANGDVSYLFARSADVAKNMGKILSESARQAGGKGGGKPEFAQGGGPESALDVAESIIING